MAHNPFEEPEAFQVCMIIAGVNNLLYQCDIISENCNEEIKLTSQIIEWIKDEVQDERVRYNNRNGRNDRLRLHNRGGKPQRS